MTEPAAQFRRLGDQPIAVIGISALFPEAEDLSRYWSNILDQIDSIIEIPESHWSIEDYYDNNPEIPDKSYCKRGGFLPDVEFNPMDYGIPPNILEVTDSSQLLGLLTAQSALEDAGYGSAPDELLERTGVILGVTAGMKLMGSLTARLQYPIWERVLRRSGFSDSDIRLLVERLKKAYVRWEENSFPGLLGNVIAGRIANRLNLGGTNCTVDAACASSLSAMKMAISDLVEHRADMMITGGVDADNSPFMYMCFSKTPAFTSDETVKPFDADSKGIMIGEGLGMVILKRLEDAEKDGDRVYALIKGIGTSSDGRFKSIYAPRSVGQAKALRRAYEDAGFSPDTVGLIEAHGTGTTAGDQAEFEGLRDVFSENNPQKQHIALGSVKSQIGHTKAAAGAAGLIKAALAIYHKILPPTINIDHPNPKLNIKETPFYLNTETRPWFSSGVPRRAGISSFGFGGTNYHFVLEEHASQSGSSQRLQYSPQFLILEADNRRQLIESCREHLQKLEHEKGGEYLNNLLNQSTDHKISPEKAQIGFVCGSLEEACEQMKFALETLEKKEDSTEWSQKGIHYAEKSRQADGTVVALFSGQGSQYLNMGKELLMAFPSLHDSFNALDKCFLEDGGVPLSWVVFPNPVFDDSEREVQGNLLQLTQHAQPAIGGIAAGMYCVLKDCGLKVDFTAGHSFGELTALWAGGVIDDNAYYLLAHARGQAMAAPDDPDFDAGCMLAVMGKVDELEKELESLPEVRLANLNSKKQVVLAGPKADIVQAQELLKAKKYTVVPLPVSAAFHTPLVGHAQKPFAKAIRSVKFKKPDVPVYSNATAKPYPEQPDKIQKQLEEHILNPVRFREEIEQIHKDGGRIFIEFGPKNVLTKLVDNILSGKDYLAVALNENPKKNSEQLFRDAVLRLCIAGLPLQKFDPHQRPRKETLRKKSSLSISLNGANYVSPETQKGFEEAFGNESHDLDGKGVEEQQIAIRNSRNTTPEIAAPENAVPRQTGGQLKQTTPASMKTSNNSDSIQENSHITNLLDQNLEVYFQQQHETLQVHREYLEQQSEYSRTVLQLMQQQLNLAAQGVKTPENVDRHLEMFHEHQEQTLRIHEQYLREQSQQSHFALQVDLNGAGLDQQGVETRPTFQTQTVRQASNPVIAQDQVSASPTNAVPVSATSSTGGSRVLSTGQMSDVVMRIVSEKTGYPSEMLELSMDLEADLGIDSIKRVEILGSLQDQLPGLPEIRGEDLAELRTLGQIQEHLKSLVAPVSETAEPEKPSGLHDTVAPGSISLSVQQTIFEIVSEKTGYPTEMLDLNMDLEADLGIDSIKRVEILGSLQDNLPNLLEVQGEDLAELRSLGQIVSHLEKLTPSAPGASSSAGAPSPSPPPTRDKTTESTGASDPASALLSVIAEKTGYPVDMLEFSMDMEADLGIDSIKRVEIMWAIQERFPKLPQLTGSELGELRTLQQIVDFMKQLIQGGGNGHDSAPITADASSPSEEPSKRGNGSSVIPKGFARTLLTVIGEKTGYPPEMLEMSMDLEADLGIDSIKRVEIMWAFQEKYPALPQIGSAEMGELRTLQQIADYLDQLIPENQNSMPLPDPSEEVAVQQAEKKNP